MSFSGQAVGYNHTELFKNSNQKSVPKSRWLHLFLSIHFTKNTFVVKINENCCFVISGPLILVATGFSFTDKCQVIDVIQWLGSGLKSYRTFQELSKNSNQKSVTKSRWLHLFLSIHFIQNTFVVKINEKLLLCYFRTIDIGGNRL